MTIPAVKLVECLAQETGKTIKSFACPTPIVKIHTALYIADFEDPENKTACLRGSLGSDKIHPQ